jgi:hypothetical protein
MLNIEGWYDDPRRLATTARVKEKVLHTRLSYTTRNVGVEQQTSQRVKEKMLHTCPSDVT